MNENRMKKSISDRRTPMNFVQRMKKQMRKTNRSISNKSVQKCTSLQRNGVQMRYRPQGMTRYPKEKIGSLSKLSRSDPRIRTPLDRSPSDIRHNVVQGRRLIIRIDRVLDQRYPKSIIHYPRSNGILYTSYPTLY